VWCSSSPSSSVSVWVGKPGKAGLQSPICGQRNLRVVARLARPARCATASASRPVLPRPARAELERVSKTQTKISKVARRESGPDEVCVTRSTAKVRKTSWEHSGDEPVGPNASDYEDCFAWAVGRRSRSARGGRGQCNHHRRRSIGPLPSADGGRSARRPVRNEGCSAAGQPQLAFSMRGTPEARGLDGDTAIQ
jgi:hypothetical protein